MNISTNPIIKDNLNATKLMQYCKAHEFDDCKVLNKEEELALIAEWKDKDPEHLKELLIMHNVAMVFKMATQFMSATRSFDEIVHNGLYGLCYAAKKFDMNQTKTKFSTYAYNWIYKYCWYTYWKDTLDKDDPINNGISLDSAISDYSSSSKSDSDSGDIGNYLENHLDPNQTGAIVSSEEQMEKNAMNGLYKSMCDYMLTSDFTDVDRTVFNGMFLENQTVRKISSDNNIPQREVKESYAKIMDLMKTKLAGRGIHSMADVY